LLLAGLAAFKGVAIDREFGIDKGGGKLRIFS